MNPIPPIRSLSPPVARIQRIALRGWMVAALALLVAAACIGEAPAGQGAPSAPSKTPKPGKLPAPGSAAQEPTWGTVRAVLDAAHVVMVTPELVRINVRLLGVEPPEPPRPAKAGVRPIAGQPFGVQAVRYIRDLLVDKQIQLDVYGKDPSGRTLAVVWLGDINVNLTLVKEGFAWVSPSIPVAKVRAELEVAERQAQVGKYGLWALPNPEPPWAYRKRHHLRTR